MQTTHLSYAPSAPRESSGRFLYRPIVFQEPERMVHPPSWLEHTPFAFWIVDALRPGTFVELGCQSGNSYASFAQAVQRLDIPTACYAVDTWQGDPHAGFFDEHVFEEWSAYHDRRFSAFSQLIRSTFDDALEHFSDGAIDLLHIDGYHTFEAVSHDFQAWRPKLSPRGVVLCHDISVREKDFGAWRLWENLKTEYPSFEFRHGHGLGVLGIGPDLPDAIAWLLSLSFDDPESANTVRLFFSRLGAAVLGRYTAADAQRALGSELAARSAELAQAATDAASMRAQLDESTADIGRLRAQLDESSADVARLRAQAAESRREASVLHEEVGRLSEARAMADALRERVARADDDIARADDDIASLRRELRDSQRSVAKAEGNAEQLSDALTAAEAALAGRAADADRLASDVRSRDVQLARVELERDASARAQRATYTAARNLDAEAAALLSHLHRKCSELDEETTRRRRLEDVLSWSRAQIAALTTSVMLERSGSFSDRLRSAVMPNRVREFLASRASGLFDEEYYLARNPEPAPGPRLPPAAHERPTDTTRVELSARRLGSQDRHRPTILVVSHVSPWRPRAGNEYRLDRMLRWYQRQGYRLVPLIAPLPGDELPHEGIEAVADTFGNVVQVHRDGRLEYILRDVPDVLRALGGTFTPSFADLLREDAGASPQAQELLRIERTFCHDAVISTVLQLSRSLGPHILQVEYIWMTRLLPLVGGDVLKVVDTIDVFSSIQQKVGMFGVRDVAVEPQEEGDRLRRADLAIAIQNDERLQLERLAPSVPIITAGVDFDPHVAESPSTAPLVLNVASNNPRNRKGLDDFLRLAWPRIRDRVPDAVLLVVGSVASVLDGREVPGVTVVGSLDDLTALYRDAALVINPAIAGTGLKIKTLEALSHLRPVVTWPSGVDGLDPKLAALCGVARDWYEFSERVIDALLKTPGACFSDEDRSVIAELVAPGHVYASVDSAYRTFYARD